MFCFQAPFECDEHLSKSFLSESEKNLHELNSDLKNLCHSDSNIHGSCGSAGRKKREKWKIKTFSLKTVDRFDKRRFQCAGKTKDGRTVEVAETGSSPLLDSVEESAILPDMKTEIGDAASVNPILLQTHDIEFIDDSKNNSQENVGDEKDCKIGNSLFETENQKSENCCLKYKRSITNLKAIRTNSLQRSPYSGVLREFNQQGGSQVVLHLNSDFDINVKNDSWGEPNSPKPGGESLKRQQINSGTSLLSLCSLFSLSKSSAKSVEKIYSRNNETQLQEQEAPLVFEPNILTSLSCCPLNSRKHNSTPFEVSGAETKKHVARMSNIVIVNRSPKPNNEAFFSDAASAGSLEYKSGSLVSSDSSSADVSTDGIAPVASPEVSSPSDSVLSSPKLIDPTGGGGKPVRDHRGAFKSKDSSRESHSPSPLSMGCAVASAKLKLLHEGDVQVCYLSHTRTVFRKVLSSKLLRRWETHHIYIREDCLCSKTPSGCFESPILFSNVDEVYAVGRWDRRNRFCVRLAMEDGSLLLQTSNSLVRDQWFSSILWKKNMHKYRNILQTSIRPEVILKEIKALVCSSLNSPLQDDCIRSVPMDIISKVLKEDELWSERQPAEEVIVALAPFLEDSTPSPEMFRFFSRHCISHPRSPVVVDVFTSIVQRILKRTTDFGKSPLMRRFVADYFKALHLQNNGDEAIRKFVGSIHGTISGCPHPRVLPNLVAVNLAAVFSHFEQRKSLLTESANETNCTEALQLLDKQLECFGTIFLTISEYEDWRPGLAQLLQPIPFPDDALSHHAFVKELIPVIRKIGTDPRCEVHETVLGIRENKEGWLNVFCPSSSVCKDEGVLWCQMLKTLFCCCCRRKSFLQKMAKHLGALLLVALRNHAVAQEMLCLMLEWRLLTGEDQEMQVVTTLQSNQSGRQKYSELCKRQEHLRELQKEGGPKKLTLPSRSTDADVARLLSCGSFGNLECLSLAFTQVTSACAHLLIQLPALRYLNLWATQFGDAGLVIIAEHLDKLQVLNLCETPVSDKGIAAIAAMKNLKKLNLNSTKLSPQTLDTLKLKLPTLQELDVRYTDAW